MRAIELSEFGFSNLRETQRESRPPQHGEVQIRMRAACLNYRDLLMVQGKYNPRQPLPLVPLSDGVGIVEAVGTGVSRFKPGDRVCPIFAQGWHAGEPTREKLRRTLGGPADGTLQQTMTFSELDAVHAPAALSDVEAACLPCAAVTAWSALFTHGALKPGESVLVQGTGGVSMFALQFAVAAGARVIVTSSSDEKLELAKAMGAAHTINYRQTPDWGRTAKDMAGGDGVDHIVEVGGAGTLTASLKAVRPGGAIYVIGVLSGTAEQLNIIPILMQNIRVQGILVGHRESFEAMNAAISAHNIHPHISHSFAWTDVSEAFDVMSSASHIGKIVLEFE